MDATSPIVGVCCGFPFLLVSWLLWSRFPKVRRPMALTYGLGFVLLLVVSGIGIWHLTLDEWVVGAAGDGDVVALRRALDRGGSVRNGDPADGPWPGLEAAVRSGNAACVELLLQRGAEPTGANWNESILDVARSIKRPDLVRLLKRYGAH